MTDEEFNQIVNDVLGKDLPDDESLAEIETRTGLSPEEVAERFRVFLSILISNEVPNGRNAE